MNIPFDECWLINLIERPDRKEYMMKQFEALNMDIKIHSTVKAPEWIYNVFKHAINNCYFDPNTGEKCAGLVDSGGAINCWREHYTLIKSAYLRGLNSIMIIEDDCAFIKNEKIFQEYLDNLPEDWDILRISCVNGYKTELYIESIKDRFDYWYPQINIIFGTGCYALNRKGMKYILDWYEIYFEPIDIPMAFPDNRAYFNFKHNKINPITERINIYISKIPLGLQWGEMSEKSSFHEDAYKIKKSLFQTPSTLKNINFNDYFI